MRTPHMTILLPVLVAAACLAGCSTHGDSPGYGTVNVRLTDDPGDVQAVNLVITEVSVGNETVSASSEGESGGSGWTVINSTPATYDLMDLQNGVFTTIGAGKLPAGHYTQVRLKIGTGSTVVVNGTTYPLTVPSGAQTGLKLIGPFDVPDNGLVDLVIDFDASRSIVVTGNGRYLLKPTAKVMVVSTAGAISGTVSPAGVSTSVYAIQSPDTLGSATTATDGTFKIDVLGAGTYSVAFHPTGAYRDTTLTGVTVTAGNTTDVGTMTLTPQATMTAQGP